jgi:hypothetical protein
MENIMRVDFTTGRFVSLEDAGLEETTDDAPLFGYHDTAGSNGSVYSYTSWFYDADDSAFGIM